MILVQLGCSAYQLEKSALYLLFQRVHFRSVSGSLIELPDSNSLTSPKEVLWQDVNCKLNHHRSWFYLTPPLRGGSYFVNIFKNVTELFFDPIRPSRKYFQKCCFFINKALTFLWYFLKAYIHRYPLRSSSGPSRCDHGCRNIDNHGQPLPLRW